MKLDLKPGTLFSKGIHPKRFWAQVDLDRESGCWEWKGYTVGNGYGRFTAMGHSMLAHRYAYLHLVGRIPEDMQVCHRCDNPCCVRPEHLFLGTNSDNQKDSILKGRHNTAKLRDIDALKIMRLLDEGLGPVTIARRLGISRCIVANIKNNGAWRWLEK